MYPSSHEIADTQHQALETIHATSGIWLDAAGKLTALSFRIGKSGLTDVTQRLQQPGFPLPLNPSAAISANAQALPTHWLDETNEVHALALQTAEELLYGLLCIASHQTLIAVGKSSALIHERTLAARIGNKEPWSPTELLFTFSFLKRPIHASEETPKNLTDKAPKSVSSVQTRSDEFVGVATKAPARPRSQSKTRGSRG